MDDAEWPRRLPLADEGAKTAWGISACFINAISLEKDIAELRQSLLDHSLFHIFGVAESRLRDLVDDHLIKVKRYSTTRQDGNTPGLGVLLYVKKPKSKGIRED